MSFKFKNKKRKRRTNHEQNRNLCKTDNTITLSDSTTAADIEDWDSLTHIMLLSAVEDSFGIKFDMKAVQGLKDVGAMADLIGELLA